ncbi:alkyl hydroperoxide reductase [Acrocarpospora phusangensis]|uniref:Alkyl hydroperoxide reductase n=1 Tax=Acrocarpospora phusangensis TaxID=1070424 RepID=A0A919QAT6_9ACTN|nr:peroxiredoxin-like family protein [Acrocarpospora phusangensis]GIH25238.1 alkyl hydroperoxide reductase [Acrocarpospora phusangensis]
MATMKHGTVIPTRELASVNGPPVTIPDPQRLTHLQFRRFAGCPLCNLHLRAVIRRHAEIEAAGIREVVVFHSPAAELAEHAGHLPFPLIADPGKRLYVEFAVESKVRSLLDPRVWGTIARAATLSTWRILRRRERPPAARPHGGRFGLPADFLIGQDGTVLSVKYGEHAYDQWSVDELLALASSVPTGANDSR